MFEDFGARLESVRERIGAAAARAGREAREITLVAVTKGHPFDAMRVAREHGVVDLGESRVQDALPKLERVDAHARVHLIGRLQTNKVNKVVGRFDSIMTVDRDDLLERIDRRARDLELRQQVWIQVNVSDEDQKGGVAPEGVEALWGKALRAEGLQALGLMAMARFDAPESELRASFSGLRELAARLTPADGASGLALSMGMSGDFEIAVEEGSTCVRVGTDLFGPRA